MMSSRQNRLTAGRTEGGWFEGTSRLSVGVKRGGFELSGDDSESSVLAAFQLVQSDWGQPGLAGWGSVVDNTEMKGPIDLEKLIFPPAPCFGGN